MLLWCSPVEPKITPSASGSLEAGLAHLFLSYFPCPIGSLSSEILSAILDLVHPSAADLSALASGEGAARAKFLSVASLVCTAWREETQRLLWREVALRTTGQARAFAASGARRWSTRTLVLYGRSYSSALPGQLVASVMRVSRAVKTLLLFYVGTKKDPLLDTCFGVAPFLEGELSYALPCRHEADYSTSISDLETLELSNLTLLRSGDSFPPLPFQLASLGYLGPPWTPSESCWRLIPKLLSCSPQTVNLHLVEPDHVQPARDRCPSFVALPNADSILSLTLEYGSCTVLGGMIVSCTTEGTILHLVKQCTNLEELFLERHAIGALKFTPRPIKRLRVSSASNATGVVDRLEEVGVHALSGLEWLGIELPDPKEGPRRKGIAELEEWCELRKITLEWG
jgi:hypothetical protein